MKTLFFSVKGFEQPGLEAANAMKLPVTYSPRNLCIQTAGEAEGYDAVCVFAGDDVSAPVLQALAKKGVQLVAVRAAGYDNVDLQMARKLRIGVANVPAYSPYAIAEHAVALLLALNRKLIKADLQVHRHDFRVDDLVGVDLHGKTVGVIGTGRTGSVFARIMHGFGCRLLGHDIHPDKKLKDTYGLEYTDLDTLCRQSDIISIHTSLTPQTKYLINKERIRHFKKGMLLINTSRGGCVNTAELLEALEEGRVSGYGADVYEYEKGVFFYDWSGRKLQDLLLNRLLDDPRVLITPHQAFATKEALKNIAETTFYNLDCWNCGKQSAYELAPSFSSVLTN